MKKTISIVLVLALGFVSMSLAAEDTWTTKANMPRAKYVLSSSVVNGKVYAIGGYGGNRTVEAYDPETDTWTSKTNMSMAREAAATSVVDGKIYVIGGATAYRGAILSAVEAYDPETETWTRKADMPTARVCITSSVVNGKIYVIGGGQGAPPNRYILSTVEEYDPTTDTWTKKAEMPTARAFVSTSAVNGKIYAIGGNISNPWYQGLTRVEEYDPATDTWTKKADMPTPRTYHSTCVVNGKIYAIGGLESHNSDHVAQVEEYDPATDTWTRVADIPTARSGLATSVVNGKIYAIGGWVGVGTTISTVEEYDTGRTLSSPDFNGDGIVDAHDMCIMVDYWGTDEPLCDIGPMPWGDGVVDVQDLIVLSEYLFEEVEDPTLIAHWPLDETEGMFAADSVGSNNAIVLGGATWQPDNGQVDGALELDGVSGYAITSFALNPADGPFSIIAWINGGEPGQVVISQQATANWLAINSEGYLMTELKGAGRSEGPLLSEIIITDGKWHRIGLVWNGFQRRLYVDSIIVTEDTQDGLKGSENGLNIGTGNMTQPGTYFSGLIDDVRIYDRAVSP